MATKQVARPESLMKGTPLENVKPGQWWQGEYELADGGKEVTWARVSMALSLTRRADNAKVVQLIGVDATGERCELVNYRGFAVPTLTAAQARRCGLGE